MMSPLSAVRAVVSAPLVAASAVYENSGRAVRIGRGLLDALERAPQLVDRADRLIASAEDAVGEARAVIAGAARAVDGAGATVTRAERVVDQAADAVAAVGAVLQRLRPLVSASTESGGTVARDAASLLARSLPLLDQIERTMVPVMRDLGEAVPELRDVLPVLQRLEPVFIDMDTRLAGLPGSSRLLKRGEKELDEAQSDDAGDGDGKRDADAKRDGEGDGDGDGERHDD